jgi:hypothetical protein
MFAQHHTKCPGLSTHHRARAGRRVRLRLALGSAALCCLFGLGAARAGATSPAARATAKTVSLVCHGGGNSCTAVVSLAGGASNEKLRIALSDTDLKLVGIVARPAFVHGAHLLSAGSYSLGGSLYTTTLNAAQSIPRGATLTLRFAVPTP